MLVCEKSISSYISSSLNSGSLSVNVFTGIDNEDKSPPVAIVQCGSMNEVVFNSRCYEFDVSIIVKEIAYDETVDSYSTIAGNVLSLFTDSVSGSAAISSFNLQNGIGMRFWQIRIDGYRQETSGDAWVNNFNFKFIGALVPV